MLRKPLLPLSNRMCQEMSLGLVIQRDGGNSHLVLVYHERAQLYVPPFQFQVVKHDFIPLHDYHMDWITLAMLSLTTNLIK